MKPLDLFLNLMNQPDDRNISRASMVITADDERVLKGGHLPADKVGGRRVANKKDRRASENEVSSESSDDVLNEVDTRDPNLALQLEKSYPTDSVRRTHEKPLPTRENHNLPAHISSHVRATNQVFQPKKNN